MGLCSFARLSNHSQKRVPLGTLKNIGEYTVEMRPSDKKEDSTSLRFWVKACGFRIWGSKGSVTILLVAGLRGGGFTNCNDTIA